MVHAPHTLSCQAWCPAILLGHACQPVTCMEERSSCRKDWHIIRAKVPADPAKLQGGHC